MGCGNRAVRLAAWAVALAAAAAAGGCRTALFVQESSLGYVPAGVDADSAVISPDRARLAVVSHQGPQRAVMVDGLFDPAYDEVISASLTFSPDSRRLAYVAKRGKTALVVLDGVESPAYDAIGQGLLCFSPDGRRLAYGASRRGQWFVVVDGAEGKPYDELLIGTLQFTPDGRDVVYGAKRGRRSLVIDRGVEGKAYDGVGGLTVGPDGGRVAYVARVDESWWRSLWRASADAMQQGDVAPLAAIKPGCQHLAVVDGREFGPYDGVWAFHFSPDGRGLAFKVSDANKQYVVVDGVAHPDYPYVFERGCCWSPDSRRVAYRAILPDGEWSCVVNGVPGVTFNNLSDDSPRFSPDGRVTYKVFCADSTWLLVVENDVGPRYPMIGLYAPYFSPDGRRVAYDGWDAQKRIAIVLDGVEQKRYYSAGYVVFSPDSRRWAYIASPEDEGYRLAVIDGVEGPLYDSVGYVHFSADSHHAAYKAKKGDGHLVVVDGLESPAYTGFPDGVEVAFDGLTTLHAIFMRGEEFLLVRLEIGFDVAGCLRRSWGG